MLLPRLSVCTRVRRVIVAFGTVALVCGGCAGSRSSAPPPKAAAKSGLVCRGARVPKLAEGTLGGPGVLPLGCVFLGVAAASPTDVWTVGARILREHDSHGWDATESLVEHWDGRGWRVVSTPNVGGLDAVVAVDHADVWAASNGHLAAGFGRGALLRWDGSVWRRVPAAAQPGAAFSALAATGTNDVWAIGSTGSGRGVVEHWTGRRWRVVLIPPLTQLIAKRDIELTGIVARRHGDVWVAGTISPHPRSGRRDFTRALVLHWTATAGGASPARIRGATSTASHPPVSTPADGSGWAATLKPTSRMGTSSRLARCWPCGWADDGSCIACLAPTATRTPQSRSPAPLRQTFGPSAAETGQAADLSATGTAPPGR